MALKHTFISLLLSSAAVAAPANAIHQKRSEDAVEWGPCPEDDPYAAVYAESPVPLECGSVVVPLDWTAPDSNKTHVLSLVRAPAPKQPAKGSIQTNPGGPGLSGKEETMGRLRDFLALSGREYNIVAMDPRGVSAELPFVCTTSEYASGQVQSTAVDMGASERDFMTGWAWGAQVAGTCQYQGNGNETAEYIGTVATARDMARVAEVIDEDGLIRYWGISYGTTLGATIAAMFPERIDRMIIDGVQNAKQYYHGWTDQEEWILQDKVIDYFFDSCVEAGPEICSLASLNRTGAELSCDFRSFIKNVTDAPFGVPKLGAIVNGYFLKNLVYASTYATGNWTLFADTIAVLVYGTEDKTLELLSAGGPTTGAPLDAKLWGIHCGDRIPRTDNIDDITPALQQQISESYFGGLNALTQALCAQWPWKAKEVYQENFEAKTKHPLLVLSNSLDGQTPLLSAKNMSAGFEGAVVLENDAVGHAALSYPNSCIASHILTYWLNGTMPSEGTLCEAEWGPFEAEGRTWEKVVEGLDNGTVNATDNAFSANKWLKEHE